MTGDENDHRALADLMPEFLEQTGIEMEVTSPALGALNEKTLQNLQTPQSSFELIMYLGFLTTQQVGAGYYDQLNKWIEDPAHTPADWDFADFLPPAMANVGIFDMAAGTVGKGKVPAAAGQTPRAIQGGWGVGIPANADPAITDAAWLALMWITSKRFNEFAMETYQIDASRGAACGARPALRQVPRDRAAAPSHS